MEGMSVHFLSDEIRLHSTLRSRTAGPRHIAKIAVNLNHSLRRHFEGFIQDALTAWPAVVTTAMSIDINAANKKTHHSRLIEYEKVLSHAFDR